MDKDSRQGGQDGSNSFSELTVVAASQNIEEFEEWLSSADGGLKDKKCAKQHAVQLTKILAAVGGKDAGLEVLLNRQLVKRKFLHKYVAERKLSAGTIKSYLTNLHHLYSYQLHRNPTQLTTDVMQQLQSMIECVKRWSASYRKEHSKRALQKHDDDMQKVITPKQILVFEKSTPAKEAVKLMANICTASTRMFLSQQQFVLLRDFLLVHIELANANRAGVLCEMTVDQANGARNVSDRFVITVHEHKTAWKHGPVKIVLSAMVMSWLKIYVKHVRTQVTADRKSEDNGKLFLSWNGEPLSSGQISKCLQTMWKKSGLGSNITCTLVRKSAVSAMHSEEPNMQTKLANLMCHNVETAHKYYRLADKEKTSVAAAQKLGEVMRRQTTVPCDTTQQMLPVRNFPVCQLESAVELSQSETDNVIDRVNRMTDDTDSDDIIPPTTQSRQHKLFDTETSKLLASKCEIIIRSGPISIPRIKETLESTAEGRSLLAQFSMDQINNRLKYVRRQQNKNRLE